MARTKRRTQAKASVPDSSAHTPPAPARRKLKPLHVPKGSISFGRHRRLCAICQHPDRFWIGHDFLHWMSPPDIADRFHLPDRLSVYRHAHAVGLFALRRRNLRSALEFVLESAGEVKLTAHGLISAVRAYTQITDDGQWIEIPKRVIITHKRISKDALPAQEAKTRRGSESRILRDGSPTRRGSESRILRDESPTLSGPGPDPCPEIAQGPKASSPPPPPAADLNSSTTEPVSESVPTGEDPITDHLQYGFYPGRMARRRARRYGAYQAADVPQSGDDN